MTAHGTTSPAIDAASVEARTRQIGREIFHAIANDRSGQHSQFDDRLMRMTMDNPRIKVQLFRFVDALPSLRGDSSVRRHLDEYLAEAEDHLPGWMKMLLALAPSATLGDALVSRLARSSAAKMARRFIAGASPREALTSILALRSRNITFTADLLGEAIIGPSEADSYQARCLELLQTLAPALADVPLIPLIDTDHLGPLARVNLSLKLTGLTPRFDAIHPETTTADVLDRLRPILIMARALGAFVNVDMEQYSHKQLTYDIFKQVMSEPEFRDWANVGIVCQAYLRDAENDLRDLLEWAKERGTPVSVRLVKGAYWDYEVLHAQQSGWGVPVYEHKWETDANYERCSTFLLENHEWLEPAFASHNVRSLAHAIATAEALGVATPAYEIQMLYGMGDAIQRAIVDRGLRLRVYTPYGAMLPGMAYLVRRLLENTSNESFLKASLVDHAQVDELLQNPEETGAMWRRKHARTAGPATPLPPFTNEPATDFNQADARDAMRAALENVRGQLGQARPMSLAGRWVDVAGDRTIRSTDPGDHSRLVGMVPRATVDDANRAVEHAAEQFRAWSQTPPRERADVLIRAAAIMRTRKLELAAWEVFECAKPWREADADVAEAIDFCEFYAREMIRIATPAHRDVPGETNAIVPISRGVAVVIPPWNFPLAIPTGMTVAALVAGNTVILKPAEQSPIITYHLARILEEAGLPAGVLQYVPGTGEEVGQALVNHPKVNLIAFTGSREVGLLIYRQAAENKPGQDHVKRVIAEMGGKNAIIVTDDADLDEAIVGVLKSAFSYAGQKCSACSRAIVLQGVYDAFTGRLRDAFSTLHVGPAEDPDTDVPPVIDTEARERILQYQQLAAREGTILGQMDVVQLAARGNYVGPMIVSDVAPSSKLAQEEIFGPVLAVIRANDLDEALQIANGTPYALTGGLYSRSPADIDRVKREFRVGNLYINRGITGALVDRQPFGGFKLSGIGTKAGGSHYLHEFLLTQTITENTARRGFAPEPEPVAEAEAIPHGI